MKQEKLICDLCGNEIKTEQYTHNPQHQVIELCGKQDLNIKLPVFRRTMFPSKIGAWDIEINEACNECLNKVGAFIRTLNPEKYDRPID